MITDKEIIISLAKELARRDYEELCGKVSTLSFFKAYKQLGGYNFDDTTFDVNYKSIQATIYKEKEYGGCIVHNIVDVWITQCSSPIATIKFKKC